MFFEVFRFKISSGIWGTGIVGGYLTPPSCLPQQQKSTPLERGCHQRHLTNSGGWVPIKGEPGTPHHPRPAPQPEGRVLGPHSPCTPTHSHRIQLRPPGGRHGRNRRSSEGLAGIYEPTGHTVVTSTGSTAPPSPIHCWIRSGGGRRILPDPLRLLPCWCSRGVSGV